MSTVEISALELICWYLAKLSIFGGIAAMTYLTVSIILDLGQEKEDR